jgi:hypothetical protein
MGDALATTYEGDQLVIPATGQGPAVYKLLRCHKEQHTLTAAAGTQYHCAPMAAQARNQVVFDWLDSALFSRTRAAGLGVLLDFAVLRLDHVGDIVRLAGDAELVHGVRYPLHHLDVHHQRVGIERHRRGDSHGHAGVDH